jgi:hypothetical protein
VYKLHISGKPSVASQTGDGCHQKVIVTDDQLPAGRIFCRLGAKTAAITTHPLTYGPLESLRNFQGSATQHEEQKQHRAHEGSEVCVEIK